MQRNRNIRFCNKSAVKPARTARSIRSSESTGVPAEGAFEDYRLTFRLLRQLLGGVLAPFDLLVSGFLALKLADQGPTRVGSLSTYLGISPAATTELIDRLEARRLLHRVRDPADRRAILLALTSTGRALLQQAKMSYAHFLESIVREMDPEDLAALRRGSHALFLILVRHSAPDVPTKGGG